MVKLVDMLITGHHRLYADEHHAAAKARRKRIAIGGEAIRTRKEMAKTLAAHLNINLKERGSVWE
jgi:hypothetical protein